MRTAALLQGAVDKQATAQAASTVAINARTAIQLAAITTTDAAARLSQETAVRKAAKAAAATAARETMETLEDEASAIKQANKKAGKALWNPSKMSRFGSRSMMAPFKHMLDAALAYLIGVVSGVQDMAQTLDESHCKFPDYYMYKTITCACGDTGVHIAETQRQEKIEAHWCTGTIKLLDAFGRIILLENEYSYDVLYNKLHEHGNITRYLRCLSQLNEGSESSRQDCTDDQPTVGGLDTQPSLEIYSISVLAR